MLETFKLEFFLILNKLPRIVDRLPLTIPKIFWKLINRIKFRIVICLSKMFFLVKLDKSNYQESFGKP